MEGNYVIELYTTLESLGIKIWIDGGWGVDALLGEQTREHADVDIVIQNKDLLKLRELLETQGYKDVARDNTSDWNFVLGDDNEHLVDVHAVIFDEQKNGLYGPKKKGTMYPADSLSGIGIINGEKVRCISAEWMIKFHSGYKLVEKDHKDISALCKKFNILY